MNDTVKPELLSLPERLATLPLEVQALFTKPENGMPDNISKAGCLALARLGKDAWNAWREVFPVGGEPPHLRNCADFSGVDFRDDPLDFSRFVFGDDANFSGVTFGDAASFKGARWGRKANFRKTQWGIQADFQGAQWGELASFQNAQWANGAKFQQAQWGRMSCFNAARWGDFCDFESAQWAHACSFIDANWGINANFKKAHWVLWAKFQNAQWGENADFSYASWGQGANFEDAAWGGHAVFTGARWEVETSFCGAKWVGNARFEGAQWGREAKFERASWGGNADFSAAQWGAGARFHGASWLGNVTFCGKSFHESQIYYRDDIERYQDVKIWAEARGLSPDAFQSISFAGAYFAAEADFSNRKFTGTTDFGCLPKKRPCLDEAGQKKVNEKNALTWEDNPVPLCHGHHVRFNKAPKFHGCELHQDTTFDGAEFPPASGSDEAARAYRTLKLAFSKQQALREEQRFFKLEMEEEALRERGLKRGLFWAYKHFSDYGFSVWRPLCWALGVSAVMAMLYGVSSMLGNCLLANVATCHFAPQWLTFSLLQTLPVPGVDKMAIEAAGKFLPDDGWWGVGVSVLVILHKAVVIVALFLAGLALRNLFRLK